MKFIDALHSQRLFFDGGTGTLLQAQGLKGGELQHEILPVRHQAIVTELTNFFKEEYFNTKKVVYASINK